MSYCHFVDEAAADTVDLYIKRVGTGKPSPKRIADARKVRARRAARLIHRMTAEEWPKLFYPHDPDLIPEVAEGVLARAGEIAGTPPPPRLEAAVRRAFVRGAKSSLKVKAAECEIPPRSIPVERLVFRAMTDEHVPLRAGSQTERVRCRLFAPFKQYMVRDGKFVETLRSHWTGGFDNGEFREDHGKMTERLAGLLKQLCDKFAMMPQWSGYSYNDDMKSAALMQLWLAGLKFDESSNPGNPNPFAYYTTVMRNSFLAVLDKEKRQAKVRDSVCFEDAGSARLTAKDDALMWQEMLDQAAMDREGVPPPPPRGWNRRRRRAK